MRSRKEEIRRQIEKRDRERARRRKNIESRVLWSDDEYDFDPVYHEKDHTIFDKQEEFHPLFRKDLFLLKILGAAVLVLIVAIVTRSENAVLHPTQQVINNAMEEEFQFAFVSDWYESKFGQPLAFLPESKETETEEDTDVLQQYALSASGKILEDFDTTRQRIAIETDSNKTVQAMNEGTVVFVGEKENFGNTVVVQHSDKSESWYGNLEETDVQLYKSVNKGTKVGIASSLDDHTTMGMFYFAIKKDNNFIDPIQVIQFE